MYLSEQRYMVPACYYIDGLASNQNRETWATILVNQKYIRGVPTAPLSNPANPGAGSTSGPVASGVFYCPSGLLDVSSSIGAPTSNTDGKGATALRVISQSTFIVLDNWYGINGTTQESNPAVVNAGAYELPAAADRIREDQTGTYRTNYFKKQLPSKKSSEIVLLFDGYWMNASIGTNGGYRINGRHNRQTQTNLLFCDGHAGTYPRKSLPTNGANGTGDFTLATLNQPPYNIVKWRTDQ